MPTLLSLFDGSGGFPLAGALCGITPIAASEVEPYPIAVTKSRFPNMKHLGDISKINGAEIEPVNVITFGSPCQDLSVAGKRAGLKHEDNGDDETTRSGLFMEAIRIIKEMRDKTNGEYPRFAVWENVPGAFSSNKGEDFRIVLEELIKIVEPNAVVPKVPQKGWAYADSYCGDGWSLAYRVLDAQYWGVPQRRRRIYLVADFGGQCAREILFEREGLRGYFTQGRTPWKTTTTDAQGSIGADDREGETVVIGTDLYNQNLTGEKAATLSANSCMTATRNGPTVLQEIPNIYKNFVDVELEVAVRKYDVDTERLSECLRFHKGKFTNKEIADALNKPLTLVEHWFRQDKYFAIPDPDIWLDLKKLLGIETTEFDKAIMEFVYDGGNYDMRNRIYIGSTSPTLTCESGNALYLLPQDQIFAIENHPNDSRVKIDESGKVQALTGRMGTGGGNVPMVMEPKPFCKSARGKFPGDAPTYKDADVANTLNVFDLGEARANELIVEGLPVVTASKASFFMRTEEELASTLVATDYKDPQLVCYCLQGNGIDRADTAGCNGKGWCENKGYTLNTIDRPAVVYAVDQGGGKSSVNVREDQSPTLTCTHDGSPAVAYQNKIGSLCTRDYKGVGSQYVSEDKLIVEKKPLGLGIQSSSGIGAVGEDVMPCLINGDNPGWQNGVMALKPRYVVRRLTPTECARLQGFADRWGDIDIKKKFSEEEYRFWLDVRNTHAAINGRQTKEYTKVQMLTWYNKLLTDSAEYKMWGNGIALPCALYVMQGIEDVLQQE